jgi:peptide/nickel transport system substrate-binding protein
MALSGNYWTRRRILGAGAAAAGGLLLACGKRSATTATPSSSASSGSRARAGGTITLADAYDAATYDPSTKLSEVGRIMAWTNDSLMAYKAGSDIPYEQTTIIPALAARWEQPDPQSFTLHLQPNVSFASAAPVNGRKLTSDDVKFSYEYLARSGAFKDSRLPPSSAAPMLAGMASIETPDPSTVTIRFSQPYAPFMSYAASQWLPIVAHEIFDADGDFSQRVVGTGPFQMDVASSQRGSRWVYKKNPTYFRQGMPNVDQVIDLTIAENAAQDAAFLAKQLDILDYSGLSLERVQQIEKTLPAAVRASHLDSQSYYLYMNVSKPPFSDPRVRQALAWSLDRDEFIKTFSDGKGAWALAAANPDMFTHDETAAILKRDPSQALQLMRAAGYGNGVDVEFIYATSYGDLFVSILQLIQSQAKKGGVNITLKGLEHASESGRRRSGDYQLGMTPRGQGLPIDLDSYVYGMFHPNSSDNQARVNDPELTPLLEAQRRELDNTKRQAILKEAVTRINSVPWCLALFYGTAYDMHQQYINNFARNTSDISSARYLTNTWVNK